MLITIDKRKTGGVMEFRKLVGRASLLGVFINLWVVSIAWGLTTQQIAQKSFPSVVLLVMEDANGQPLSMGSGFFVRDSIVATNLHVIKEARGGYAKIVGQKKKYNISGTVGIDSDMDLVLLSLEEVTAPALPLGNSGQVQVGDEIYAVGNPLGLEGTFSKGIVSGIRQVGSETLFQLTAPISPGSSGGAILNTQGQVVGVAVATFQGGQNLNFAIPVYYLNSLLSKTTLVKPLSIKAKSEQHNSVFDSFGKHSLEGVVCEQLIWRDDGWVYSFSLRNQLGESVKDIVWIAIYYDKRGNPIDFYEEKHYGVIRPNLAKRIAVSVDSSVRDLLVKPIELRVIDFKIVE